MRIDFFLIVSYQIHFEELSVVYRSPHNMQKHARLFVYPFICASSLCVTLLSDLSDFFPNLKQYKSLSHSILLLGVKTSVSAEIAEHFRSHPMRLALKQKAGVQIHTHSCSVSCFILDLVLSVLRLKKPPKNNSNKK